MMILFSLVLKRLVDSWVQKISVQCVVVLLVSLCPPACYGKSSHSLKYFGYYASSATNDQRGNPVENTAVLAKHVNLVWLSENDAAERFAEVRAANRNGAHLHVVFSPYWTFFVKGMTLHPDYVHRWQVLREVLDHNLDLIMAFYPVDEPYHRAARFTEPKMNQRQAYKVLSTINDLIKSTYREKKIWVIFSCNQINEGTPIPANIDSIGLTCYGSDKFPRLGIVQKINKYYSVIGEKVGEMVSFLVIPEAFYSTINGKVGVPPRYQDYLLTILPEYYSFAKENDRVIGFIPFLWQNYSTKQGKKVYGVESMESVRAYLNGIADDVIMDE